MKRHIWSEKTILEYIKDNNIKSRSELYYKNNSAYNKARKLKLLDIFPFNGTQTKPNGYWTEDKVIEEAKKYKNRKEFAKKSYGAFRFAKKNDLLNQLMPTKQKHAPNYWNKKENVINEAKKYNNALLFQKYSSGAYNSARRNNWLKDFIWLFEREKDTSNERDCVYGYFFNSLNTVYIGRTLMRRIKERDSEHRNPTKNEVTYRFSKSNNIEIPKMTLLETDLTVDEGKQKEQFWTDFYRDKGYNVINKMPCGSVGSLGYGKWTEETVILESKKYKRRSDFMKYSQGAYRFALKNNLLPKLTWLSHRNNHPKGYWKDFNNVLNEAKKYNNIKEFSKKCFIAFNAASHYKFLDKIKDFYKNK